MEEIMNLISNFGIGIVCLGYLIYFQSTTMKEMQKTMQDTQKTMVEVVTTLTTINNRLNEIEHEVRT